jgi:hypothetical protein
MGGRGGGAGKAESIKKERLIESYVKKSLKIQGQNKRVLEFTAS